MALSGFVLLIIAFVSSIVSAAAFVLARPMRKDALTRWGTLGVAVTFFALLAACCILVVAFMTGDTSILYVLEERSLSTDGFAWLYKLAGLWAGRAGSLLFWVFLISLFNVLILARWSKTKDRKDGEDVDPASGNGVAARARALDVIAMAIVQIVIAIFCALLLFASDNMPFTPTPAYFFNADGSLTAAASLYSMNQLLEHWAMAIHPPLLFIGYAGLTVPFAYGMAALIADDPSKLWVERTTRFVLASWLFLGAGIGLGAVWAYVVLGWGGYWGWDPVENASLLSWLVCVALVHTFTVYRQRGQFKRWAVLCACLAFTFVIVATFITRSGIVQSVHAFVGDPVSLALFGGLIVVSLICPIIGLIVRRTSFGPSGSESEDIESMVSKDAAYYFNNVVMMVFVALLTYMTISSALPSFLPFGGESLGATAYEAIARPLGIVYLFILAVCPLLSWGTTDRDVFMRQAKVPAICAVVLAIALIAWWAMNLKPAYDAVIADGGSNAMTLLEAGPSVYYHALAIVGILVASLLFFNALFLFVRNIRLPKKRAAAIGGGFAHIAMAVLLVGLIGSSMYVYEKAGYLQIDAETHQSTPFAVQEYTLDYASDRIIDDSEASNTIVYEVTFDVYRDGTKVGQVSPSVQVNVATQQRKLNAAVLGFPEEDLFVVYQGVNQAGWFSLDVRINPLINLVWIGFAMLMIGTAFACFGRRRSA
ncbi:MAG: cytochrome c biogenesis protein CcsA [Eggerthellaceae bacterium]|nr:cytochrome c biogenesis protein CcsA [Eggerthellaceae bacterium]